MREIFQDSRDKECEEEDVNAYCPEIVSIDQVMQPYNSQRKGAKESILT